MKKLKHSIFRETAHNEMLTNSLTEASQNKANEALELPPKAKSTNGNGHRFELSSSSIFFDDINRVNKEDEEEEEEDEENEVDGLLGVAKDRLHRFSCL